MGPTVFAIGMGSLRQRRTPRENLGFSGEVSGRDCFPPNGTGRESLMTMPQRFLKSKDPVPFLLRPKS